MSIVHKTYLQFIDYIDVTNWSVQYLKWTAFSYNKDFELLEIGDFLIKNKNLADILDSNEYKRVTVKMNNKWVTLRDIEFWKNIGTKRQFVVAGWEFIMSKIDARNGAFWIVPNELAWAIVTNDFPTFHIDTQKLNPDFFVFLTWTSEFLWFAQTCSSGTTGRQRINMDQFLKVKIPLPGLAEQDRIVEAYQKNLKEAETAKQKSQELEWNIEKYLMEELGIEIEEKNEKKGGLRFVEFRDVNEWWTDKIGWLGLITSKKYQITSLGGNTELYEDIKRWKSPEYSDKSSEIILNQKCNRWDEIDLQFSKTVDSNWFKRVDKNILTQEWDILINSTWEGTIWRASVVRKWFTWLLYDSHLLLLRLNKKLVNANLFVMYFNSFLGQEQVNLIKSAQATKQTELWIWNLSKINFPLPPLEIQEKIVTHITAMKDEIKRLKKFAEELRENAKVEFEKEIFS